MRDCDLSDVHHTDNDNINQQGMLQLVLLQGVICMLVNLTSSESGTRRVLSRTCDGVLGMVALRLLGGLQ